MVNIIFLLFLSFAATSCGGSGAQGELALSDAESTSDDSAVTAGMGTLTATSDNFSVEMTSENLAFTEASSETYRLEITVKPYDMAAESTNFRISSEPLPNANEFDDESE